MSHQYSPETLALIAAAQAGTMCDKCGAADHLEHFDECPRHPENI